MKKRFIDALIELTDIIETMTAELMKNGMENYSNCLPNFSKLMEMCFPQIVLSYFDPLLSEVSGDVEYWTNQFERILNILGEKDKFAIIDVLYHETRVNLLSFIEMIKDTPLAEVLLDEPQ